MNIKKLKESSSPLVGRTEIIFQVSFPGEKTPSHEEVQKAAADLIKVDATLVDVYNIKQNFGDTSATVEVFVYKDASAMKTFGVKPVQPKEKKEEAK